MTLLRTLSVVAVLFGAAGAVHSVEPCRVRVVDSENGWPVPLVELKTTHGVRFHTDNAGVVAFDLPELMGVETWLFVFGHGYAVPADGFGNRGVKIIPRPGETIEIRVDRQILAKRMGRITGAGLFAESQKLGDELDWKEQRILGCDSVQNVVHRGKLFWGWGDTTLADYPLGRFHMLGATTATRPLESFEPPVQLRYDYFVDDRQIPRNTAEMPGEGPTWLSGYASLPDREGKAHLVASYAKIEPPLAEYERGLCVWNESTERFDKLRVLWTRSADEPDAPDMPQGHPASFADETGEEWMLFGDPFPALKCRATFEDWSNPDAWTVLQPQAAVPIRDGNEEIQPHRGAIAWNAYRRKWVAIFTQLGGDSSHLGELWYAEADAPTGPWGGAVKVVTHDKYTFYNPQLHPGFTEPGSPILFLEATYTHTFSRTETPTPRHDYNQVLYRLDLNEL